MRVAQCSIQAGEAREEKIWRKHWSKAEGREEGMSQGNNNSSSRELIAWVVGGESVRWPIFLFILSASGSISHPPGNRRNLQHNLNIQQLSQGQGLVPQFLSLLQYIYPPSKWGSVVHLKTTIPWPDFTSLIFCKTINTPNQIDWLILWD